MDFWIELSIYYTELSLVWKLIACGTGLLAAGLLVMYMMMMLFPYGCLLPAALGWTSGRKSGEALSEN